MPEKGNCVKDIQNTGSRKKSIFLTFSWVSMSLILQYDRKESEHKEKVIRK
jgi:hypothetical protein